MLINLFGRWVNPQNILAVISATENAEDKNSKIIFNNSSEAGFVLEINDKNPAEIAAEINTALAAAAANKKSAYAGSSDRGGYKGGGDRGGYKGGGDRGGYKGSSDRGGDRDGGFKKKFDRPERSERSEKPAYSSDDRKEKVREDFGDRKKKFDPSKKFSSSDRGDFKPKKRKDW